MYAVVQIGSSTARLECGTTRSTLFCACAVPAASAAAATAAAAAHRLKRAAGAARRLNVVAIVRISGSRTLLAPHISAANTSRSADDDPSGVCRWRSQVVCHARCAGTRGATLSQQVDLLAAARA